MVLLGLGTETQTFSFFGATNTTETCPEVKISSGVTRIETHVNSRNVNEI